MKKTVIKSPWGDFLKLQIGNRTYERSAMGNFWERDGKNMGFFWGELRGAGLSAIACLLPVSEVVPDKFSAMLRAMMPPEKLDWMK